MSLEAAESLHVSEAVNRSDLKEEPSVLESDQGILDEESRYIILRLLTNHPSN